MFHYLFTNDLRISSLDESLNNAAKKIMSDSVPSAAENKSENNNIKTLAYYFNLTEDSNCSKAAANNDIRKVVLNFIRKFQFPNPRTNESLAETQSDGIVLAPLRLILKLLYIDSVFNANAKGFSRQELTNFIFYNEDVAKTRSPNIYELYTSIIKYREDKVLPESIETDLTNKVWNQEDRQIREMLKVLTWTGCVKEGENDTYTIINNSLTREQKADIYEVSIEDSYWDVQTSYNEYMDLSSSEVDFKVEKVENTHSISRFAPYLAAIKTKPFILMAGISGTGKSRLVRELARATDTLDAEPYEIQKPENYEMIQVRPNWHDSTELMGYVSRVSGKPRYVLTDFVRFLAKAWLFKEVPFFLCLDEMNLAPVEQYFAEYLSVFETRNFDLKSGEIITDRLVKFDKDVVEGALNELFSENWAKPEEHGKVEQLKQQFKDGISVPPNLIVMGTVNMDETTFSFSRKVLDRAMSFEMNEVNLQEGLDGDPNIGLKFEPEQLIGHKVKAEDIYPDNKDICNTVLGYLNEINDILDRTPFKVAYRTRNEFMIYVVNRLKYEGSTIEKALDEATHMKVLSRIEGDKQKLGNLMDDLTSLIQDKLQLEDSKSVNKLNEMILKLGKYEYVDFWE